jgi:hypothetical protein
VTAGRVRRVTLISATALFVAGIASACGETKETVRTVERTVVVTTTVEAPPAADSATSTSTTPTQNTGRTERSFGGVGIDEGIAFRVTGWETVTSVPQEYDNPVHPVAGAKFVLVTVNWSNKTKTAADPFCGGQGAVLIDSEDRNFEPKSSEQISIPGNDICEDLQPGFQRTDKLLFELPNSAKPGSIALWNSDSETDYSHESYVIFSP